VTDGLDPGSISILSLERSPGRKKSIKGRQCCEVLLSLTTRSSTVVGCHQSVDHLIVFEIQTLRSVRSN